MKNLVTLFTILTISLSGLASADLLKPGISIAEFRASMKKAGYTTVGVDEVATDRSHALEHWSVGGGAMSVRYSRKSNKVLGLGFTLRDERAKAYRKTFSFLVEDLDTITGQMTIHTKTNKGG